MATTPLMKHQAPQTTEGPMLAFMLGTWFLVFAFLGAIMVYLTYAG